MKIIIDNVEFPFNEGCKLLKLKHGSNTESPFKEIEDFWNEIEPLTFKEIITTFNNVEQRRIALSYLGLENLSKEINSKLVSSETISKETTWVNKEGVTETIKFEDKYELYTVDAREFGAGVNNTFGTMGISIWEITITLNLKIRQLIENIYFGWIVET